MDCFAWKAVSSYGFLLTLPFYCNSSNVINLLQCKTIWKSILVKVFPVSFSYEKLLYIVQ